MKGAGYSVPGNVAQEMENCVKSLWMGSSDAQGAKQCESNAMGTKYSPGSTAASFASKWGGKK